MALHLPAPDPLVAPEAAPFWEALGENRLVLQRCQDCHGSVWYPRGICPRCGGRDLEWVDSDGAGEVYSYTIVRRGQGAFAEVAPYVLAYVTLDEGPTLVTNIVTDDVEQVRIGQRVEAVFDPTASGHAILRFRPAST